MGKPLIDLTGAKVLIVDDTPENLRLLRQALEPEGYSILVASNGEGALKIAGSAHPDLILLDVQMPGMDGFETCHRLKQDETTQDIPVIFVTAEAETESVVEGFCVGGVDYIIKPFKNEEVLIRVQTHLKIDHLYQALLASNIKLKEMQNQLILKEKLASMGNLVAGVSHEINSPVGAIIGAADVASRCLTKIMDIYEEASGTIREGAEFKKVLRVLKDSVQNVATAGERIDRIVRNLRKFARLDEDAFQKVNLHEGLDSAVELCEHQLKSNISIEKAFGEVPPILCFPGELNQIFMNLLLNAIQAIETQGTIRIETSSEENNAYVKISDTGVGIPDDEVNKIFDPGFTTKGVGVGLGLGLSISYDIAQKHRGEITVESEVGKGSTFTLRVPVA